MAVTPRIRNLTPHDVVVRWDGGEVRLPTEGVARVTDRDQPSQPIGDVPVVAVATGEVVGLPDPQPDVVLLVSRVLAAAVPERTDLVFPYGEIRDSGGRIEAVRALAHWVTVTSM